MSIGSEQVDPPTGTSARQCPTYRFSPNRLFEFREVTNKTSKQREKQQLNIWFACDTSNPPRQITMINRGTYPRAKTSLTRTYQPLHLQHHLHSKERWPPKQRQIARTACRRSNGDPSRTCTLARETYGNMLWNIAPYESRCPLSHTLMV